MECDPCGICLAACHRLFGGRIVNMLARSIDVGFCEFALIAGKHGFALPELENTPLAITDNIQSSVGFGRDCNVSDYLIRGVKPFGEFLRAKNAGIINRWLDRTIFAGGRCTKQPIGTNASPSRPRIRLARPKVRITISGPFSGV